MRIFRQLTGIFYFYFMSYVVRDPVILLGGCFRNLSLIALFLLIGGTPRDVVIGGIVALLFGSGMMQLSVDINALRFSKFKDMMVSSPVSPLLYALGAAFGMSLPTVLNAIPLLAIYTIFFAPGRSKLFSDVIALLLIWISGIMMGFLISLRVRVQIRLMTVTDVLYSALVYLMPVYYPIRVLPEPLSTISLISPAVCAAEIIRGQFSLFPILLAYTAFLSLLAARFSRWREK